MAYIYFIQEEGTGAVKIGISDNPLSRLANLQHSNSKKLTLLSILSGDILTEKALQKRFIKTQIRGEWFEPSPDLLAYIKLLDPQELNKLMSELQTGTFSKNKKPKTYDNGMNKTGNPKWLNLVEYWVLNKIQQDLTTENVRLTMNPDANLNATRRMIGQLKTKDFNENIDVDIFEIHGGELGQRLQMPVEMLIFYAEPFEKHRVLQPEAQFVAKMAALLDRGDTPRGQKYLNEMWQTFKTFKSQWKWQKVLDILSKSNSKTEGSKAFLEETFMYFDELTLSRDDKRWLRKEKDVCFALLETTEKYLS
jgi:hypothetical protein